MYNYFCQGVLLRYSGQKKGCQLASLFDYCKSEFKNDLLFLTTHTEFLEVVACFNIPVSAFDTHW